jgi:hypothetical protein
MKNIVYFILSQWLEFSAWSSLQYAQCHESSILIFKDTVHQAGSGWRCRSRVSFETSFDSKQPKLEPKLVSALFETKCLFRLLDIFDVSIEPKRTEDQPKQFDREHIFLFFTENVEFFRFFCFFVFFVFFGLFRNRGYISLFQYLYTNKGFLHFFLFATIFNKR